MWLSLRLENVLEKYGISDMIESVDGKRRIILNQVNCFGNNRSQAQKNSGYHYLRACRPIFPY